MKTIARNKGPKKGMRSQTQGTDGPVIPLQVLQLAQLNDRVIKGAVSDCHEKRQLTILV